MYKILIIFFLGILHFQSGWAGYTPQWFLTYDMKSCVGAPNGQVIVSGNDTGFGMHGLSFSDYGFWNATLEDGGYLIAIGRYGYIFCSSFNEILNFTAVYSPLPYDFDDSSLLLSEGDFFDETKNILGPESSWLSFSSPITVESWVLTGNQSFALYEDRFLNGSYICIHPDSMTVTRGRGIHWGYGPIWTGSVTRGCPDDSNERVVGGSLENERSFAVDGSGKKIQLSRMVIKREIP